MALFSEWITGWWHWFKMQEKFEIFFKIPIEIMKKKKPKMTWYIYNSIHLFIFTIQWKEDEKKQLKMTVFFSISVHSMQHTHPSIRHDEPENSNTVEMIRKFQKICIECIHCNDNGKWWSDWSEWQEQFHHTTIRVDLTPIEMCVSHRMC